MVSKVGLDPAQADRQDKLDKVSTKTFSNQAGISAPLTKTTNINYEPEGGFLWVHVKGFMDADKVVNNKAAIDETVSLFANPKDPEVIAFMAYVQAKLDAQQAATKV